MLCLIYYFHLLKLVFSSYSSHFLFIYLYYNIFNLIYHILEYKSIIIYNFLRAPHNIIWDALIFYSHINSYLVLSSVIPSLILTVFTVFSESYMSYIKPLNEYLTIFSSSLAPVLYLIAFPATSL